MQLSAQATAHTSLNLIQAGGSSLETGLQYLPDIQPTADISPSHTALRSANEIPDMRKHLQGTLANHLCYSVISDPKAIYSAAALRVDAGSNQDPDEWPGLAHAVEHTTFINNAKFEKPYEYLDFILSQGGKCNAETSAQSTTYYFQVKNNLVKINSINEVSSLECALDRLSASLSQPAFSNNKIQNEITAVDREYNKIADHHAFHFRNIVNQTLNPEHPETRFNCGNAQTLADKPMMSLRDAAKAFYQRYYSADRMHLSISGPAPVEELKKLAETYFSKLPARQSGQQDNIIPSYLAPHHKPVIIKFVPPINIQDASFMFCIPAWPKAQKLVLNLFNSYEEGGFRDYILKNKLALFYHASEHRNNNQESILQFKFDIPSTAFNTTQTIQNAFFDYVDQLKMESADSDNFKWRIDESKKLFEVRKLAENKKSELEQVAHEVQQLSKHQHQMLKPTSTPNMASQVKIILNRISEDRLIVIKSSKHFQTNMQTSISKTPYSIETIQNDDKNRLTASTKLIFKLPSVNKYAETPDEINHVNKALHPALIYNNKSLKVWHSLNTTHNTPNIFTAIYFEKTNQFYLKEEASLDFAIAFYNNRLDDIFDKGKQAGIEAQLQHESNSFRLIIKSTNANIEHFIADVFEVLRNKQPDYYKFGFEKRSIIGNKYRSLHYSSLSTHIQNAIKDRLNNKVYNSTDVLSYMDFLDSITVSSTCQSLFKETKITALLHGKIEQNQAERITQQLKNIAEEQNSYESIQTPILQLNALEPLKIDLPELKLPSQKTGYVLYIQSATTDIESHVAFKLLRSIMSFSYFEEMRTKQELTYTANVSELFNRNRPGLALCVETNNISAKFIHEKTLAFFAQFDMVLNPAMQLLSDERFNDYKLSLTKSLKDTTNDLANDFNNDLEFIKHKTSPEDNPFTSEMIANAVMDISREKLQWYYREYFLKKPCGIAGFVET